jgi:hypothetical protein
MASSSIFLSTFAATNSSPISLALRSLLLPISTSASLR